MKTQKSSNDKELQAYSVSEMTCMEGAEGGVALSCSSCSWTLSQAARSALVYSGALGYL